MITVQTDFCTRVSEINAYFEFINKVDSREITLQLASGGAPYTLQEHDDLLRTLKASVFLLLYNLMESTVSNAVEAIFDELASLATPFDTCRDEIRKIVLSNLKQHDPNVIMPELRSIATDIVSKTFRKNEIFSGNVDAREIREVAQKYGFAKPSSCGDRLLTVKSYRNDLAHGTKSFAEVGRDVTVMDAIQIKDEVIIYLSKLLKNVETYIDQKLYLAANIA